MKKMSFTYSRCLSLLARSLGLLVFAFLFSGINEANAQDIVMAFKAKDTTSTAVTLQECGGTVTASDRRFTDDAGNDGNYSDPVGHFRRDTVEICPKDKWSRVKVVFTDFDLATGDTLFAFNATRAQLRAAGTAATATGANFPYGAGSGAGTGVAKAFGGWIDADCDPAKNSSGCLTFIFKTDGNNQKGSGWDAWVDCEARKVTLSGANIADVKLKCSDSPYATVSIPAPKVEACSKELTTTDSVFARVKNQHGVVCADLMLSKNGVGGLPTSMMRTFAIGQYAVEYKLKSDTTKTLTRFFSVQAPALVCNDEIKVPMGAACMTVLTPDDILEQPCDTLVDTMYYNITITLGTGKKQVVLKTKNFDNGNPVEYPIITAKNITDAGLSVCGGTATVRIERIYYGRTGTNSLATIDCNNGKQSVYCETQLVLNDESKPWVDIAKAPDTLVACDTTGLAALLEAKGVDNCDTDVPVTFTVTLSEKDPCFAEKGSPDTTTATVVFSATDDCGNVGTASKVITMIRPDIHDQRFVAKTKNISVECTETAKIAYPGVKIGVWKNNKFEVKDTVYLNTKEYICGYILTSYDEDIPGTDCGKKTYRYWDALDWCDTGEGPKRIDTTFIEYTDKTAPKFAAGSDAARDIELDHFSCTYDITKVPAPKATDNCDPNPAVRIDSIFRIEDGKPWGVATSDWKKLDCDSFHIRWIAEDACHEQKKNDTVNQIVVIKDVTKPSAICVDQLNVSLPNEWGARVHVKDVNAGSYDACGIETMQIRIKGTNNPWDTIIDIGCEYVHPDLQIEMRVVDKKGNENICWLDVLVEDKINPYCEPLDNVVEDCDKYHNGELGASTDADEDGQMEDAEWTKLEGNLLDFYNVQFGNPALLKKCEDNLKTSANCGALEIEQQYQLTTWPCGEAKAQRRYRAKDWTGNYSSWVVQHITINYKANWKVTFPSDWEGSCGDMPPAASIDIVNGACDLLGYEVTEKQFDIPGDACFKIERTYHIINWCKYVAGDEATVIARVEGDHGFSAERMITSEGNEDKGYFTYIQVLKVHDDEAPVVTVIDPEPCINGVEFDALPYGEEDITPGAAPFECDEEKTWTATATDCSSNISWVGRLFNATTGAMVKEVNSHELTYIVSNKETYYAEFWAYDNCGNSGGNKGEHVKFWDCKKPTPYVLNGVAVELMPTGMVQVWATDLNQNSFDNCTDQSKLDFRIWADFLGEAPADLAGVQALDKNITFDCNRVGTNVVHIYVIDEEGNWDFAQTYVIVQDNLNNCPNVEGGMVAGSIVNANGENVESVIVSVTGASQGSMTTGADGKFAFTLGQGENYTLTPQKEINPLNGVSTFDLVLISKHILGITTFDSPYKYIAADVNKSGSITAFDMVQLRQLILNITSEFPSNDSWRFVDAKHNFSSANPAAEDFAEFHTVNNLATNMENLDFVGVKVGDVNGNAQANSLLGAESRTTNGALTFNVADRFVEAGQTVTVDFASADMASTEGYQFTLKFAGLELAQLNEGVAKAANFNTNMANRGLIATSWNGEATADEVLFSITFNATTSGMLSELVSVNSELTAAEAYNTAGELLDVNIDFTTAAVSSNFELGQNTPNPFNGETVIGFNLPKAGTASLKVMDVQGKVLKHIEGEFAKGYNTVRIKANELGATGVLHYQLESADQVATKKMIIIE